MTGLFMRALFTALLCCQLSALPAQAETQILFRMTGSNTVGAELAPRLVKGYLRSLNALDIEQRSAGERHWISAKLDGHTVEVPITALGSSTAFNALNKETADIGMASRKIKQKELNRLARFGNLASAEAEHVIGLDALVIAVHPSNPVNQLTLVQLKQIYSGEIKNWAELGGADLPIRPLHRDIESGTRATFDKEVFGRSRPAAPGTYQVSGNTETLRLVLAESGAIGYLPFAETSGVKKVAIKAGNLAATVPDQGIIATEDFPFTRRLYLYKNPSRFNPHVDNFLHFAESPKGQELVAETGYINLTPVLLKIPPYPNAPAAYRKLMESGERLSISFRFADGSAELDSRALKDLHRLEEYIQQAERSLNLTLVGFSDQKSNNNITGIISRFRALTVQGALLYDHQLTGTKILSLGAFAPLTADREQAPIKNNRVEVWIN